MSSIEITPELTTLVVDDGTTQILEIGVEGPQGPPGVDGGSYVHTQAVPSSVWTISHGLGFFPNVTVLDTLGRPAEGDPAYPSVDTLILTFSAALTGQAFLS